MRSRKPIARRFALGLCWAAACSASGSGGAIDSGANAAIQPDDTGGPSEEPPSIEVELGTGAERFESLTDGQEVVLVQGPQGGFHVWAAVRIAAPALDGELELELGLEVAGTPVAGGYTTWRPVFVDGVAERAGLLVILFEPNPWSVDGEQARLVVAVSAQNGQRGADSVAVVPRWFER